MSDVRPTISTTIGALVDAEAALARLTAVKLDAKTRYHAVKLARLVNAETKEHFQEPRLQAFKDFAVKRDPTPSERAQYGPESIYDIALAKPDAIEAFGARIKELREVPVVIPWGCITSTMLENYPEFTAADCLALGPLFELVDEVKT